MPAPINQQQTPVHRPLSAGLLGWCSLIAISFALTACIGLPRETQLVAVGEEAEIPGHDNVRSFPTFEDGPLHQEFAESFAQEVASGAYAPDASGNVHYASLVLSGGADYGAFGAGVLNGWSATGERPEFKLVTGVSTGALIAPLAFLGPEYDDLLKEEFTTIDQEDVFTTHGLIAILIGTDALTDSTPLRLRIADIYNDEVMARVAVEHNRGRRLYVLTTNLDSELPIVWNLGAIANSGAPGALQLSRQVILASASPPGVFPPVLIDAEINGNHFQEMHVDGGVVTNTLSLGALLDVTGVALRETGAASATHTVYLIRNGYIDPKPRIVDRNLTSIIGASTQSMIKWAGIMDTFRIHLIHRARGEAVYQINIPGSFEPTTDDYFDTQVMNDLFALGKRLGADPASWSSGTPQLEQLWKQLGENPSVPIVAAVP